MSEYITTDGTAPDLDEQHEPRTIERRDGDDTLHMMTEIGDGVFVQWGTCARDHKRVGECSCPNGPEEPSYIGVWRTNRFRDSFKGRGVEPALPVVVRHRDRRVNAVLRLLRSQGWTITNPEGDTLSPEQLVVEDLAGKQRDMMATAIEAVQEQHDPESPEEPDNLTGMDLGDGMPSVEDVMALGRESLKRHHPTLARELEEESIEATKDDLEFARDTLGPTATDDEVQALADDRAARDHLELLKDREDKFDAGF